MSNFEIIPVSSAGTLDISPASNELSILDSFEALEFEFDDAVDKASRLDYGIAAGSGLLTGLLSVFLGKPLSIEEAAKIGGKEADKIVIDAARAFGCDLPNDKAIFDKDGRCSTEVLAKAIKFLEDKFPIPQDKLTPEFGGGLQHHLRDFSHHPTVLGLFFSILGQFTGTGYGTDTDGNFIKEETMKRAVERSKLDRKTNVELVETMWEQFCNLGIYESNVIDTTTYSIQETVSAVQEKIASRAALLS